MHKTLTPRNPLAGPLSVLQGVLLGDSVIAGGLRKRRSLTVGSRFYTHLGFNVLTCIQKNTIEL